MNDFDAGDSGAFGLGDGVSVAAPSGIDCVLAAGRASETGEISEWLRTLPEDAYGKVFVEASAAEMSAGETLPAPEGVSVTWLRSDPSATGVVLARAVHAWLEEWLWAESQIVRNFDLWTSTDPCATMQDLWDAVDRRLAKRWPGCAQTDCAVVRELGRPNSPLG